MLTGFLHLLCNIDVSGETSLSLLIYLRFLVYLYLL